MIIQPERGFDVRDWSETETMFDEVRRPSGQKIGQARKGKGGSVILLTRAVSPNDLFQIRKALDERDGGAYPDRQISFPPKEPKRSQYGSNTAKLLGLDPKALRGRRLRG